MEGGCTTMEMQLVTLKKKKTIKLYTLFFIYLLSYFFGQPPCLVGILVPPPRIEPVPPTVEVWNPKY